MLDRLLLALADIAKSPGDMEKKPLKKLILSGRKIYVVVLGFFLRGFTPIEPIGIQVETTINCNLKCVHCERTYWPIQKYNDLSFDDFKKIIDPLRNVKSLSLTGVGEPLLNRDLLKMAKYAKAKGMHVAFTTNATMINERTGPAIIESGVDLVCFSMESADPATFEKIRVGAKFDRIVENIKRFLELKKAMHSGTPEVELRTVALVQTVDEIPGLVRLAKDMGIRFLKVNPLVFEFKDDLQAPDGRRAKAVHTSSMKLAEQLGVDLEWPLVEYGNFRPGSCIVPYHTPFVFIGGQVAPCCLVTQRNARADVIRKYTFGNVLKTPYSKIMNNRNFVTFRRQVLSTRFDDVPGVCKDCWMLQRA